MNRVTILGGIALLASLTASPCAAQGASEEDADTAAARALFEEGLELADRGEWERAVQRFRAALEHRESARVHYNLAVSLARMGRLVEALDAIDAVLADPETDDGVREESALLRDEVMPRLGRLHVEVDGGQGEAHVTVDGRPWLTLGVFAPADPGVRVVRLVDGDVELDIEEADVPEGGEAQVMLEHPAPEEHGGEDDSWIWATVIGSAIVVVGAAVVTAVVVANP